MNESETGTGSQEAPEQKKEVLMVEHDGKEFIFSHVNNQFFPRFVFLQEAGTDDITTVAWVDLEEEIRQKITDHLKQPKKEGGKTEYPYDRELYLTLLAAPYNVKEALKKQAEDIARASAALGSLTRHIDARDEQPSDLLEEVAMGIATAKKKGTEYGRTFAPNIANLILTWLKESGLNPQKLGDRISVDFSDQKK